MALKCHDAESNETREVIREKANKKGPLYQVRGSVWSRVWSRVQQCAQVCSEYLYTALKEAV